MNKFAFVIFGIMAMLILFIPYFQENAAKVFGNWWTAFFICTLLSRSYILADKIEELEKLNN